MDDSLLNSSPCHLGTSSVFVVGAGGIGCAVGYALRAAGVAVTFVDADADKVRWGLEHGVCVDHQPPLPATFLHFDGWSPTDAVVLLCTKCYDNATVLNRLPASVTLIPIQNGFDPALAKPGGAEGIASFISECLPGRTHTRITRRGRLHLGVRGGEPANELPAALGALLQKSELFSVEIVPDILPYKYTKLMYNAAISPIASAAGLDNGGLLWVPKARRLFFDLLSENYSILRDAGVPLGKVGPFHPDTVHRILTRRWVANAFAWAFYPTLRKTYCSMASDLPRGRTEIDYYNGHLIDLAGDRPCPLNRRVYELICSMQSTRVPPSMSVLDEFALDAQAAVSLSEN
jgi:2-dehydropantoate 2-reductase